MPTSVIVLVDTASQKVLRTDRATRAPADPQGAMWLTEGTDFLSGAQVNAGMCWDGTRRPKQGQFWVEAGATVQPTTVTAALDAVQAATVQLEEATVLVDEARDRLQLALDVHASVVAGV